jgi:hypothetical protein
MDDTHDYPKSLTRWFRALPESQRRLVPVAAVVITVAAGWGLSRRSSDETLVTLPNGLAPAAAIAQLNERGIATAQPARGNKLIVPADKSVEARRFLDELASVSTSWADEWERSNSQLGQFSGNRERDAAREIARARMIGRLLRQMPGVAQADVVWDEEEQAGWRAPQKTRCTVYLRPKTGFEITADMARSVRQAVAGSKKHLAAEDIVVMDLDRMTTFDAVPAGVDEASRIVAEREIVELRHRIENELRDCPGARVNVSVNWTERDDAAISISPVSRGRSKTPLVLASGGGFLDELSRDDESTGRFEPSLQVTITAPEDSAEQWASRRDDMPTGRAVAQASFEGPKKGKAADTIRQSVCTMLSKFDRRNLAKGVSVHLTTAVGAAAAAESVPEPTSVDPLWFIVLAILGCAAGAWILSSAFRSESASGPMLTDS